MMDETDVPEVSAGQTVRILLASAPTRILEGDVVEVASRATKRISSSKIESLGKQHLVKVRLNNDETLALVGSRGTAKIAASRRTLWQIASRQLREMLKLPW